MVDEEQTMSTTSFARAARTAIVVSALSAAAVGALVAMSAKAETTAAESPAPARCVEGEAGLAAYLAYLEARVVPEAEQQDAWKTFATAVRASAEPLDRLCREAPAGPPPSDPALRLEGMAKHVAALETLLEGGAKAYSALAPTLTPAQREVIAEYLPPMPAGGPGPRFGFWMHPHGWMNPHEPGERPMAHEGRDGGAGGDGPEDAPR
jgi:hypothetical protein